MPEQSDGANLALPRGSDGKKQEPENKCRWSRCKGHVKDIDKDYPSDTGNVERQGQKIRHNLVDHKKEPWNEGGHGETNIREMYLDKRHDGVITIKSESYPYRIEGHHLIPVAGGMGKTSTLKKNAVLAGWDINHITNGMLLPKDAADVALHLLQQHDGNHPGSYTDPIETILKDIEYAYQKICWGQEGVSLQRGLAGTLETVSNTIRGKIIAIRQHEAGVEFWRIRNDSLQVYQNAVKTWFARRERYIKQEKAQRAANAQSGRRG